MAEAFKDRYQVQQTFSGYGSLVYKALDKSFDRVVAVKAPDSSILASPNKLQQFVTEGRMLAKFDHPNIIGAYYFHEAGEFDECCYLVCPWMDLTLDSMLDQENLSAGAAVDILLKILEGVRAIHNHGLVHRDLKPTNIFLSLDQQQVKIGDLGIASSIDQDETLDAGKLTPKYHAPEVLDQSQKVSRRTDIYSLGMLAYEMFLGKERFTDSFSAIYGAQGHGTNISMRWLNWHQDESRQALPLSTAAPEIPSQVAKIVERMMVKQLADRYPDVDVIIAELREALGSGLARLPYATIKLDMSSQPKPLYQRKVFYWACSVTVVLGACLVVLAVGANAKIRAQANSAELRMKQVREGALQLGLNSENVSEDFPRAEEIRSTGLIAKGKREYRYAIERFDSAGKKYLLSTKIFVASKLDLTEKAKVRAEEANAASLSIFKHAVNTFQEAQSSIANEDIVAAVALLAKAQGDFHQTAAKARWRQVKRLVAKAKPNSSSKLIDEFNQATVHERRGADFFQSTNFLSALDEFVAARSILLSLIEIRSLPVLATIGSNPEELQQALSLCAAHANNCDPSWYASEVVKKVELMPFSLDRLEVSNRDFAAFINQTAYQTDAQKKGFSNRVMAGKSVPVKNLFWASNLREIGAHPDVFDFPVVQVSYNDALAYCQHHRKRLPTAAEWEYIARGSGRQFQFPWGNQWDARKAVWASDSPINSPSKAATVGSLANGDSYHHHPDLAGNVWEWTATEVAESMLLKGGSWAEKNPANLRGATAASANKSDSSDDFGFRCASSTESW